MKSRCASMVLAGVAGLAMSSVAYAQAYNIVTSQPGAFIPNVDTPANLVPGSQADDAAPAITIPSSYQNGILAGAAFASTNGRVIAMANTAFTNAALTSTSIAGYYPMWDDLDLRTSGTNSTGLLIEGIYTLDTGTRFVVQWNARPFSVTASGTPEPVGNGVMFKMQLQIYPDGGPIVAQYLYQGLGSITGQSATIGLVSQAALEANEYSFNLPGAISDSTVLTITPGTPPVFGACCFGDGSCAFTSAAACAAQSGVYAGDNVTCANANCPQPGACCLPSGHCSFILATACASAGGVFNGVGSQCGAVSCPMPPNTWVEQGNAGDLPQTANITQGTGPLFSISGTNGGNSDVDMYRISICDFANFSASTVGGATWDTQLFLFDAGGFGVAANDDEVAGTSLQSTITSQFIPSNGQYYLAISGYNRDPVSNGVDLIFSPPLPRSEVNANGPGAGSPIDGWVNTTSTTGTYTINLTGACFSIEGPTTCYANCDGSTTQPILNVADFTCFLTKFAAGDPYANCDGSTTPPVLNVADFTCFLTKFAAGC
jgi:hypothetical protein